MDAEGKKSMFSFDFPLKVLNQFSNLSTKVTENVFKGRSFFFFFFLFLLFVFDVAGHDNLK